MTNSSNYSLRAYRADEAERAADIRGLTAEDERQNFKKRLEPSEGWSTHYKHLALVKDDLLIGDVQLRHCSQTMPPGVAHFGIDVAEEFRGQGAATKALELAWDWARQNNIHRLEGSTDSSNIAMQKAFEKAGWNFEGVLKNLFLEDGIGHDYRSYAKTI